MCYGKYVVEVYENGVMEVVVMMIVMLFVKCVVDRMSEFSLKTFVSTDGLFIFVMLVMFNLGCVMS